MNIAITGSTGLVGSALIQSLSGRGGRIYALVRSAARGANEIEWHPESKQADAGKLEGMDAVVHLAGENIAGRWNAAKKTRIRESRVQGTHFLAETLAKLSQPPKTLVCASAIGYYGSRGSEVLTESSAPGNDFLAEVCREWEAAAEPARAQGIRVVNVRFGMILSKNGGALAKMLTPFKFGGGGIVGSGQQYWSWVAIDDAIGAILHAIGKGSISGPVNVTTPNAPTNREFTKVLGKVLSRPTIFPMPAFAARLAFGEMADALLLASARVEPKALSESGYNFALPQLEQALRHLLK